MSAIKSSGIYLSARLGSATLSLLTIAVFTRILSPERFGIYALIFAGITIGNALFFTWTVQAVFRHYSVYPQNLPSLLKTGLTAFLISSALAALILGLVSYFFFPSISGAMIPAAVFMLIGYGIFEFGAVQLNLEARSTAYFGYQIFRSFLGLVLPTLAIFLTNNFAFFVFAVGLSYWAPNLVPYFRHWLSAALAGKVDFLMMRDLLAYGSPMAVSILVGLLTVTGDRFLIGSIVGTEAVATYAAGYDLAQYAILMVGSALMQSFCPRILERYAKEGRDSIKYDCREYILLMCAIVIPAGVGLGLVSYDLIGILIGEELREGSRKIIPIISIACIFMAVKLYYFDFAFQVSTRPVDIMLLSTVLLIFNLSINLYLIPRYGAVGAASAAAVSFLIGCFLSHIWALRNGVAFPLPLMDLSKIILATTAMGVGIKLLDPMTAGLPRLLAQVAVGGIVYTLGLYVFRLSLAIDGFSAIRAFLRIDRRIP